MSSRFYCIGGFPGIGSVGKVAADFLIEAMDTETVRHFRSPGLPPQVMIVDGQANLFQAELKLPKDRDNLLLLSGDAQPMDVKNMYILAGEILEEISALGATDIITLAAYVGESPTRIMATTTAPEMTEELERQNIGIMRRGLIGGLNGLLIGMAPRYGLRGVSLLGVTPGEDPVDLKAAKNLIEAVTVLLNLEVSLDSLNELVSKEEEPVGEEPVEEDLGMYYR